MKGFSRMAFGIHPLPSPAELQIRACSFDRLSAKMHIRNSEMKQRHEE